MVVILEGTKLRLFPVICGTFILSVTVWSSQTSLTSTKNELEKSILRLFQNCLIIAGSFEARKFNGDSTNSSDKQDSIFDVLFTSHLGIFRNTVRVLAGAGGKVKLQGLLWKKPDFTKFYQCQVAIRGLWGRLEQDDSSEINQAIVIFIMEETGGLDFLRYHANTAQLNISAISLILERYGEPMRLWCPVCSPRLLNIPSNFDDASQIKRYWLRLHRDLKGHKIRTSPGWTTSNFCNDTKSIMATGGNSTTDLLNACFSKTLESRANVTFSPTSFRWRERDILAYIFVERNTTQLKKSLNFDVSSPGTQITSFGYLIMAKSTFHNGLHAMTQPFQGYVWLSIFGSMLLMPLLLTLTTSKKAQDDDKICAYLQQYFNWAFLTLASMVDQCNDSVRHLFRTYRSAGLWLIWNFVALIIMNSYDGQLYSFLASDNVPEAPDSLRELAQETYPISTISTYKETYGNGDDITRPLLENMLAPFPRLCDRDKEVISRAHFAIPSRPRRYPAYFKKLLGRLHVFPSFLRFYHLSVMDTVVRRFLKELMNQYESRFVLLDKVERVNELEPVYGWATEWRVIKRKEVSEFFLATTWLLRKDYALNIIHPILWQLVESGLNRYWSKCFHIISQLKTIQSLQYVSKAKGGHKSKFYTYNVMGYLNLVQRSRGRSNRVILDDEPMPMSLNVIRDLFRLCGGACLFTLLVLLMEVIHFKLKTTVRLGGHHEFRQRIPSL